MATYNGGKYLQQQLDSILLLIGKNDELVVSDDGSTDDTLKTLEDYANRDNRIVLIKNMGSHGAESNFSNAISTCKGNFIFLADQDDIWINDKINRMISVFENTSADMVIHNGIDIGNDMRPIRKESLFSHHKTTANPFLNFIKCTYSGCCMAVTRHMANCFLPFPSGMGIGHDVWAGIYVGLKGKIVLLDENLILHRLHGDNVTPTKRRSLLTIAKSRYFLLCYMIREAFFNRKKNNRNFKSGNDTKD